MEKVIIFAILIGLAAGAPSEDRINGGVATTAPVSYIVAINEGQQLLCGGFIYNDKWVVTAASCVDEKLPSQLTVVFGQWSLIQVDPNEKEIAAFKIVINPGYNRTNKLNDVALIELATVLEPNIAYELITYDELDPAVTSGTFMGWGALTTGGQPTTKLRTVELPIVSGTNCTNYTTTEFDANFMICAGNATVRPCGFDEGGPLVVGPASNAIAVGIYSKNKGCSTSTSPAVFTRLSVYYAWLSENAGPQVRTTTIPTAPCQNCQTSPLQEQTN